MRKINESVNFTKKEMFNLEGANTLQTLVGQTIKVSGVAIGEDIMHDTGEVKATAYIKTDIGMFSTISETAIRACQNLLDIFSDEPNAVVDIEVSQRKSSKGRDFLVLSMK